MHRKNKIIIKASRGKSVQVISSAFLCDGKPLSFKIRPRAITRLINGEKLTRSMSMRIYRRYIKSPEWNRKVEELKGKECEICGYNRTLDLHHLSYRHLLMEKEKDVATLCRYCHEACHFDENGRKLRNPSMAIAKIINRIRNGNKLKREAFSLFLSRRYKLNYGKELELNYFRKFFYTHVKDRQYPFGYSIVHMPSHIVGQQP